MACQPNSLQEKNKLLIPWLAKNLFLLVVGSAFGFYNIYWVVQASRTDEESSFWGSLCGLYWVILGTYVLFESLIDELTTQSSQYLAHLISIMKTPLPRISMSVM
jgi:hypothetical protein